MKRILPPLARAVLFCALGMNSAFSETNLELIDRAQKNLQTHLDAAKKEQEAKLEKAGREDKPDRTDRELELAVRLGGMLESYALQNATRTLAQVRDALVSDQDGELSQALRQLGGTNLTLPDDVRKDVDALIQAVHKDQTDREDAYNRDVESACKRASEVLAKATDPKELDQPLQQLTEMAAKPPGWNRYNGGDSGQNNKLRWR